MQITQLPLTAILLATVVGFVAASELGRWVGRTARRRSHENVATVEGAMLGLLALIVGFTFALGLSRFEAKRAAVLAEANAIGTAALRAQLLPPEQSAEALTLFRDYVALRLDPDVTTGTLTPAQVSSIIQQSSDIQRALWQQAKTIADRSDAMVPTGLYVQSLNDMFDNSEARIEAVAIGIPDVVLVALHGIAIVASFFMGYAAGMEGQTARVPPYTMIALIGGVLLIIHDLDRPREGFITTSQQPMRHAADGIAAMLAE